MADEFFDDEQELMESAEGAPAPDSARAPKKDRAPKRGDAAKEGGDEGRQAPPFWMVLAIAIIALVLGIVIGYLIGTSTAYSALEVAQSQGMPSSTESTDGSTGTADASEMLPEGHPQLSIDEDGNATVVGDQGSSAA